MRANGDAEASAGSIAAVTLAGARRSVDPVALREGVALKAFAEIAGASMLERALGALAGDPRIGRRLVCLPEGIEAAQLPPALARLFEASAVERLDAACSPAASVAKALDMLPPDQPLLVTTADSPLLATETLGAFLDVGLACRADAVVGFVTIDRIRTNYPSSRRTGLAFRGGALAGCNLFLLAGPNRDRVARFWRALEARRKSPLAMAWTIGPATLALYAARLLTVEGALGRIGRACGAALAPALLEDPLAGMDVDTPEDLDLARRVLAAGPKASRAG